MKKLTLKESRRLIWLTWVLAVFAGIVVYFSTNPVRWWGLMLAGIVVLGLLMNFLVKSRRIPVARDEVLPTVFSPTAFLATLATFASSFLSKEGTINSLSVAFGTVAIVSFICLLPEMRYSE
jgi:hypothetical protein